MPWSYTARKQSHSTLVLFKGSEEQLFYSDYIAGHSAVNSTRYTARQIPCCKLLTLCHGLCIITMSHSSSQHWAPGKEVSGSANWSSINSSSPGRRTAHRGLGQQLLFSGGRDTDLLKSALFSTPPPTAFGTAPLCTHCINSQTRYRQSVPRLSKSRTEQFSVLG